MKKKAVCGIYEIRNTKNGKVYIGSSVNIEKRWYDHSRNLEQGIHQNSYLQRSYNKWGKDAYKFTVLEECSKDKRFEKEQFYIDKFFGKRSCYNLAPLAIGGSTDKQPEEVKKRISQGVKKNKLKNCNPVVLLLSNGSRKVYTFAIDLEIDYNISSASITRAINRGFFTKDSRVPKLLHNAIFCYESEFSPELIRKIKKLIEIKENLKYKINNRKIVITYLNGKKETFSHVISKAAKEIGVSKSTLQEAIERKHFTHHPAIKEELRGATTSFGEEVIIPKASRQRSCRTNPKRPRYRRRYRKPVVVTFPDSTSQTFPSIKSTIEGLGVGKHTIRKALKRGCFSSHPYLKEALRGARIAFLD